MWPRRDAPESGDDDQSVKALLLFGITTGLSIVVVALRFLGRYFRQQIGLDDWFMLVTLIFYILFAAALTKIVSFGGLRHVYYLDREEIVRAIKWTWICQPFVVMGLATGKLSIGILLWRVVRLTTFWRKWLLSLVVISTLVSSLVDVLLMFLQCSPIEALWNQPLLAEGTAACWSPKIQTDFAIFISIWNMLVDVFLAFLPATFFWNLNLSLLKKTGICILLGLGSMAAICAGMKIRHQASFTARTDITWEIYRLHAWSATELFLIIVCSSMPPLKSVYDRLFTQKPVATRGANVTSGCRYLGFNSHARNCASGSRRTMESSGKMPFGEEVEMGFSSVSCAASLTRSTASSLHLQPANLQSTPE